MIELQVLCKVLKNKSLTLLRQNNITADHFITYKPEYQFIMEHYQKYDTIPDVETFLSEFDDFDYVDVFESDKYLIETLQEQFMYSKMVPFVHELADKVTEDSKSAVQFVMSHVAELQKLSQAFTGGYDIVKNSDDRKIELKFRIEANGLLGITTGIPILDEITHGWLKEDFIVIAGRTNEGKTWVLLFFLVAAWLAGMKVLLYSGEMSETLVGFRFDTLNAHFSNSAMMGGNENLGTEHEPLTFEDYEEYLNDLSSTNRSFVVVTPKHIGGKRLTIPVLHQLIEAYKPDIIGIDQLSLMEDYRAKKGDPARLHYTHIAEDLYLTSEKYQKPILSPAQANRDSKKRKESDEAPELEHIAESDGVPQNATRVITIKQLGPTMKMALKKNRYGPNNRELLLIWNPDRGIIKPFLTTTTNAEGESDEDKTQVQTGVDLF